MIGRCAGACCVWLMAMLVAARVEAQRVSVDGPCASEPHRTALVRELTAVRLEVVEGDASVRVTLDEGCRALVVGANGQAFEVTPGPDVSAWAVRVAETAYALSPYAAQAPQPAPSVAEPPQAREPPPPPSSARWLELAAALGPTFVSATEPPAARYEARVGVRLRSWLWLSARGGGTFPALVVGESPQEGEARLGFAGAALHVLPLSTRHVELEAMLGVGALRLAARGGAEAPRINREAVGYAALASLGVALTYLPSTRFGLRAQVTLDVATPELVLDLGASRSDAVARTQLSGVAGPLLRF